MREIRSSGSAEGVMGNCDPYSDSPEPMVVSNHSLLGSRSRHCYRAGKSLEEEEPKMRR